jgi:hypothetical protein
MTDEATLETAVGGMVVPVSFASPRPGFVRTLTGVSRRRKPAWRRSLRSYEVAGGSGRWVLERLRGDMSTVTTPGTMDE